MDQPAAEPTEADVARELFECLARNRQLLNPTQFSLFSLAVLAATLFGAATGFGLGWRYGTATAVGGTIAGLVIGWFIGSIPSRIAHRSFFRELREAPLSRLNEILEMPSWNAWQTMALLQLAARGEHTFAQLPRVIKMLGSKNPIERTYGWNAVWMVYPPLASMIPDFDPAAPTEACREKASIIIKALKPDPN